MAHDDLADFDVERFTHEKSTRTIYRSGTGPAVIVMAEMPGMTPKVMAFARRVRDNGFTVILPHLFGVPGRDSNPEVRGIRGALQDMASSLIPACIDREFAVFALGKTSPAVVWLRALAAAEHTRCGGPGVGAVGMCFTGGFALAMATEPEMLAPVLSQPSLPLPRRPCDRSALDISDGDLATVKARCAKEDLQVIGLRFKGDHFVPAQRFERLRQELGDSFIGIELEDADAYNPGPMWPHSVLTENLKDEPGEPTRDALEQVIDLFRRKLLVSS